MKPVSIEQQLRALKQLALPALQLQYRQRYGRASTTDLPRPVLEAALSFPLQSALISQLRHRMQQTLIASEIIGEALTTDASQTVLIGEWRGRCHVAVVLDDGVVYQGQTYRSLKAVTKAITGQSLPVDRVFRMDHSPHGTEADHGRR